LAVTRHYLRNTQTVSGTGGTVYDLSTTQGSPATLLSAAISNTTYTKIFEWRFAVGTALPQASIDVSFNVNAVSASTLLYRWRLVRYNSSNVLQETSSYSGEFNTTGTNTATQSITATWASGDFLAIEVELRRNGGGGSRTITVSVNNTASYLDPDLVEPAPEGSGTGALEIAATGVGVSVRSGSGTAALDVGATGTGVSERYGSAVGDLALSVASAGESVRSGSATSPLSLGATGTGEAPTGPAEGSGIAALQLSVGSDGESLRYGSGAAGMVLAAASDGDSVRYGSAVAALLVAAAGIGQAPSGAAEGSGVGGLILAALGIGDAPASGGSGSGPLLLDSAGDGYSTRYGAGVAMIVLGGMAISGITVMQAWNGTAWIAGELKRWDGNAWVSTSVKRWDGMDWVNV
jgi:hypothetical protein